MLAVLVLWPAAAVAHDTDAAADAGSGTETATGAPADRVACDNAAAVFELLCRSFEVLKEDYVDPLVDEELASVAAAAVRGAGLDPRGAEEAPACVLPSPAFEQACQQIDAVDDTAAAVWVASEAMFEFVGDPNTFLMTPGEYEALLSRMNSAAPFVGIGLSLGLLDGTVACSELSETCRLVVSEVFRGSPAEQAGLRPDDVLVSIDGFAPSGSGCGLQDLPTFEVGSLVPVIVERSGRKRSFRMEAAPVSAATVAARTVAGTLGYLRIDSFHSGADQHVAKELEDLLESGAETLVVDLRDNPGGYLQTVIDISSMFLNDGQVVLRQVSKLHTHDRLVSGQEDSPNPVLVPMAVAVDELSASAAEVMTLALRDNGRATVVGTTTYGKNTGQVTRALESRHGTLLGGARVTVFRWLGPDESSAEGGIEPDVELDLYGCWHSIGLTRQVAAAAGLPGALPADIQLGGEAFDAVAALAADGVLAGTECGPGLFCPDDPVPRWLMAVWLVRTVDGGDPAPIGASRFADVDAGQWWAAHVERLAELGITAGCHPALARFCPDDPVTRAQMASLLQRALRLGPAKPAGFTDTKGHSHEAAIDALHAAGLTSGCSTGPLRFCPDRETTRIQMAVFLRQARNGFNPGQ